MLKKWAIWCFGFCHWPNSHRKKNYPQTYPPKVWSKTGFEINTTEEFVGASLAFLATCSLEALEAYAGVTLSAVATAIGIEILME